MTTLNRILIADDDPIARENLRTLLFRDPYELFFATNGHEAVTQALHHKPDLILLDVMMPDMDGFAVCRHLRADPVQPEVPIILITALDDREARMEGFMAGADDFLTKPIDRMELRVRVRGILRLNRYRRLLAERVKFERVVASAHVGIILVNAQDEIVFANPQAHALLNINESETLPLPFEIVIKRRYTPQPPTAWQNWPQPTLPHVARYLVQPVSGSLSEIWLKVQTLDQFESSDETNWIISLEDVSPQVVIVREYERFHMIMAHKLRTPLTTLLSSVEMIAGDNGTLSKTEMRDLGRLALRGAQRLRDDIHDVLQFIQPDGPTEPSFLVLRQLPALVAQLTERWPGLTSTVDVEPMLGETRIPLSAQVLETILHELLENAVKFHPQFQPTVRVAAHRHAGDRVQITVEDDGMVLSPEQLAHVWMPYYQVDDFLTGQIPGMGLGLPLVASYVWRAGGSCHLFNRMEGQGVVIELLLPMVEDGAAAA